MNAKTSNSQKTVIALLLLLFLLCLLADRLTAQALTPTFTVAGKVARPPSSKLRWGAADVDGLVAPGALMSFYPAVPFGAAMLEGADANPATAVIEPPTILGGFTLSFTPNAGCTKSGQAQMVYLDNTRVDFIVPPLHVESSITTCGYYTYSLRRDNRQIAAGWVATVPHLLGVQEAGLISVTPQPLPFPAMRMNWGNSISGFLVWVDAIWDGRLTTLTPNFPLLSLRFKLYGYTPETARVAPPQFLKLSHQTYQAALTGIAADSITVDTQRPWEATVIYTVARDKRWVTGFSADKPGQALFSNRYLLGPGVQSQAFFFYTADGFTAPARKALTDGAMPKR